MSEDMEREAKRQKWEEEVERGFDFSY